MIITYNYNAFKCVLSKFNFNKFCAQNIKGYFLQKKKTPLIYITYLLKFCKFL